MSDLKPRTTTVVIYQGDDIDNLGDLRRAVSIAERDVEQRELEAKSANTRMGGTDPAIVAAAQAKLEQAKADYNTFVDDAAERAVMIEVTALKRTRFRELMASHPARDGNDGDSIYGINMDDFPVPFLADSVTKVTIGDRELNPGQVRDLVDDLPEGDFERVFAVAYMLNRAPGADPREGRYSAAPRSSSEI